MKKIKLLIRATSDILGPQVSRSITADRESSRKKLNCELTIRFWLRNLSLVLCCMLYLLKTLLAQHATYPSARVEFICAEKSPGNGLIEATVKDTGEKLYLPRRALSNMITIADIVQARVVQLDGSDSHEVEIDFTDQGAAKVARITKDCVRKNLAILINNEVVADPILNEQIYNKTRIFGAITNDNAQKIVDAINCCRTQSERQQRSVQSRPEIPAGRIDIEFRVAARGPAKGLKQATVPDTGERIYLHKESIVTNRDIIEARALKAQYGDFFAVKITFTSIGSKRMRQMSRDHKGKPLAILINGEVISAPVVTSEIQDSVEIYGKFTREEADRIVQRLTKR